MNKTEQGTVKINEGKNSLIHILLLIVFCLVNTAIAEPLPAAPPPHDIKTKKHHVYIIYSPDNTLHSNIIQKLSDNLSLKHSDIIISKVTAEEKIQTVDSNTDIIIGIGHANIKSADKHYPKTKKLFIATAPNKDRLDKNKNKKDATLYMTQPYCIQLRFIKQLNTHWKTISILSSQGKPIDNAGIQKCASKYVIKIYTVNTTAEDNLTNKIKKALRHSDVLLALPDSNIYNSKTVKNILLTSYRHRKPVIAFSKSFVHAGALAAVHSNTEQITQSISRLIEQYFDSGSQFIHSINYPDNFDIDINKQVFKALDITIPDMEKLKQLLQQQVQDNPVQNNPGESL